MLIIQHKKKLFNNFNSRLLNASLPELHPNRFRKIINQKNKHYEKSSDRKSSGIADDAVDHMGPHGQPITGGANIRRMLTDMHNHMKDMKFDIITTAGNADYVFTYSTFTGTTADSIMGEPAGTKMNEQGVDMVKIKDGKIVEHWGFVDPAAMMMHMEGMGMPKMDKMQDSPKKM